jgi:hypothetical protein
MVETNPTWRCTAVSEENGPRTAFSTLCTPSSLGKRLPMVLHNGDNCLYEEPCLLAFDFFVGEVRQHRVAAHAQLLINHCIRARYCEHADASIVAH